MGGRIGVSLDRVDKKVRGGRVINLLDEIIEG